MATILKFRYKVVTDPAHNKIPHFIDPSVPHDDYLSCQALQWQTTFDLAVRERENPEHEHVFTDTQIQRGGSMMCMSCLRTITILIPKE